MQSNTRTGIYIDITPEGRRNLHNIIRNMRKLKDIEKQLIPKLLNRMARRLKTRINARIGGEHYVGTGHNTPTSLKKLLHSSKDTQNSYKVYMDNTDVPHDSPNQLNPLWVEFGTQGHWQGNTTVAHRLNSKMAQIMGRKGWWHPGSTPKFFFRNGTNDFRRIDYGKAMKVARNIIKYDKKTDNKTPSLDF